MQETTKERSTEHDSEGVVEVDEGGNAGKEGEDGQSLIERTFGDIPRTEVPS